jgi:hypothetical protein
MHVGFEADHHVDASCAQLFRQLEGVADAGAGEPIQLET